MYRRNYFFSCIFALALTAVNGSTISLNIDCTRVFLHVNIRNSLQHNFYKINDIVYSCIYNY